MKHIKKFNENVNNDAMYAIADSFNKLKEVRCRLWNTKL